MAQGKFAYLCEINKLGLHTFNSASMAHGHHRTGRLARVGRDALEYNKLGCIVNVMGCTIMVSDAEESDRVSMSVVGDQKHICAAVDIARDIIDDRIRFDACMQDTVI